MSAVDTCSCCKGASSASSTSPSPIPPEWVTDAFENERIPALRESIRGMEAKLVDLVFDSAPAGRLMDWLRMPLECAAALGELAALKRLLAAGVETEATPERLQPAPLLHLAAESGSDGVVEELLKAGVDLHEKDGARHDQTALHCAAATGSEAAVRALTSAGADIDGLDKWGWTPLQYACSYGHRGVVVFLLLKGACAQKESREKDPPLHLAATSNYPGVIEDLLSFGNVSIGRYDVQGRSALHAAAQYRGVEACLALLRGGAAVGWAHANGMTCLDVAASNGHTGQLLQVLTTAEAADDRKRMCSEALYHAVSANKPDTIRDLVALGADVEYRKADAVPTLHSAAVKGADKATEALLRAGADVEATFGECTPLHYACLFSLASTVKLLLLWGADENAMDLDYKTPSEVVGTLPPPTGEVLLPEKLASNKLVEDDIRRMLRMAPADRNWRRRGWLVLCRARWLAKIGEREKRSSAPLAFNPDGATGGGKKRRGITPSSALVVKPRDFSLGKGKARGRNEGRGRRLPEATAATAAAAVLRLGTCSVVSDGGAGQAAGVTGLGGRTRFVAVVEQLLLLREGPIFREVVSFL